MVTSVVSFKPRIVQGQVILGQIKKKLSKHAYLVHFCLTVKRTCFVVRHLEVP